MTPYCLSKILAATAAENPCCCYCHRNIVAAASNLPLCSPLAKMPAIQTTYRIIGRVLLKKLRRAQDTLSMGFSFIQEIGVRREKLIMMIDGSTDFLTTGFVNSVAAGTLHINTSTAQFRCSRFVFGTGHTGTCTGQFHSSRFIFCTDHTAVIIYGSIYGSCSLEAALGDTHQLLLLNIDSLHPSSRAATHILVILQEWFTNSYHHWFEVPSDVRDMWWGEFQKRCVCNFSLSMTKMRYAWEVKQVDLTERFSKSRHLEELHKHQGMDKKRKRFHEARQKAEEEVATKVVLFSDDFELMATVSGGLDRGQLYKIGSKAAHLRAESSRGTLGLPPCCLEVEQRIMRWVEATISSVCVAFDKHMRRFTD
ncbi:hypothetical protein M9H77_22180 [Catharanthus roseus]|uniref:Uncharacterized protein n=1 Tax=Catharanthus roseus TaxID=4058 RepID=A0ACC0AQY0_CATRO|nr:hypothetical protein M9H77_22180 [Catharanthus roseus]